MSYVVLARKYRPMRFADMVGQEHIGRTLGNAIKQDRVHHAYLFSGARGLGKTTTARIFAKGLVCEQGPTPEPCNQCSQCVAVSEGRSVDVMEIDGASNNSVDNIRNLREQVNYLPQTARRKVYIIDEVHMLTTSAFNALLKTLEEPPPHVNFVFATTEPQKVLPTILSRVNRLDFKRVAPGTLVGYLRSILDQEGLSVQEGGLRIVARAGEGSVRDALTLLDQVIAFAEDPSNVGEDEVRRLLGQADAGAVLELLAAILRRDPAQTMRRFDALVTAGNDLSVLCLQVLEHLRDLALVKVCDTPEVLPDATEAELEQRRALVADVSSTHLGQLFDRFSRVIDRLPQSRTQRLLVEMGLLDLACAEPVMPLGDLVDQLHALGRGAPPPTGGGGGRGAPRASGGRGRPAGAGMHASAEPPQRSQRPPAPRPERPRFEAQPPPFDEPPPFEPPPFDEPPPFEPPPFDEPPPRSRRAVPPEPVDDRPPPRPAEPPRFVPASAPAPAPTPAPAPASASAPAPAPATAPAPAPTPAPPPESGTFAAKLFSMGVEGGMVVRADEPAPEPAPASAPATSAHPPAPAQPERRPPSTLPSVGPSSSAPEPAPPSQAPSAGGPASDGAEIRMGAGPCLPPPPADDVIPWETLPALDAWEQLVGRIREGDEFLAAVLGQVGLVSLADGILRVAAPRGSFEHTELGRHQMRAQVEQFTRDHLGAPFTMELADGEPVLPELPSLVLVAQQRRAEHRAAVEAEARAHPGIQALLRTFDATLVSTKPLHEP